jgi:MFS family permease
MTISGSTHFAPPVNSSEKHGYNLFLLLVAGLGGLLYGIDVGIIGGALPYLEATSHLTAAQLSVIVAAVLLGSVISTLFAGILADWMGRRPLMVKYSGDRAFAWLYPAIFWTPLARHKWRPYWRGGSALSCRVPLGI